MMISFISQTEYHRWNETQS